jgi:fucose 4-O-acetylase-like acetyltransferase
MSTTVATARPDARADRRAGTEPRTAQRDPLFDNAKMTLVTLVVVGHGWALLPNTHATTWAYDFLYLWHVPAFVMVTGYLSRSFTFSRRHLTRLVTTVLVPYLVFEALLAAFRSAFGGEHLERLWLNPHWPMWYLSALFLWRLATPLLKRVRYPLLLSVAVSLAGGAVTTDALDVSRALGLLPFFVVGLLATPDHVAALRRPGVRLVAGAAFALAVGLSSVVQHHPGTEWLYWSSGYSEMGASFPHGVAVRALLLAAAGALAVAFFALVPGRGGWFTRMGAASLVVYLFHGFVVKSVNYSAFPDWAERHTGPAMELTPPAAVVVALLLAWPPVARRLSAVVDPVGAWRRRRDRTPAAA